MDAPLLEAFKVKLGGTLSNVLAHSGGSLKVTFKGPFQPKPFYEFVIL